MICAAPLAISAMPAQASVIDWTLQNVVFSDGGSASGTFSTDSATGDVLNFDITTTSGSKLGGTVYDDTVASSASGRPVTRLTGEVLPRNETDSEWSGK
jgi:hypothetical protein